MRPSRTRPSVCLGSVGRVVEAHPEHVDRHVVVEDLEAGFLAHDGVSSVGAHGEIGADLETARGRCAAHAGDSAALDDEIGDLVLHAHVEARIFLAELRDEVQEVPLRHEREELAVRVEVREVGDGQREVVDLRADGRGIPGAGRLRNSSIAPSSYMSSSVDGWIVSPRKSRKKSACFSSTVTSTPARARRQAEHHAGRSAADDAAAGGGGGGRHGGNMGFARAAVTSRRTGLTLCAAAHAVVVVGWVAEWFKAHAWKACGLERVSRVRISPHPLRCRAIPKAAGLSCSQRETERTPHGMRSVHVGIRYGSRCASYWPGWSGGVPPGGGGLGLGRG